MGTKPASHNVVEDIAEILHPVRSRTWDYWLVLCLAIAPLWSIIPISWIYVVYTLWSKHVLHLSTRQAVLFATALVEVVFSLYHYYLIRSISAPGQCHEFGELPEMQLAFHRVLQSGLLHESSSSTEGAVPTVNEKWNYHQADAFDELKPEDPRAIDFRHSLRCWFRHRPWSEIRQQDLRRWLYWAIFNAPLPKNEDDLPHAHKTALDDVLELIRRRTGCTVKPGSDARCSPLLLTLDPINVWARPFLWYLFVSLVNAVTWMRMKSKWNVQHGSFQGLEYIIRVPHPTSQSNEKRPSRPVVLMHGLGLGLFQYSTLLSHMFDALPDCPILVPLQPHISQNIFHPSFLTPMNRHITADALAGLLTNLGWADDETGATKTVDLGVGDEKVAATRSTGVTMLSHSNGSFIHAWMLKSYPNMIYRSCFVDPVAFCLWEGDVCSNFLYRAASNGIELIMRYFVATELGVANLMQRNFDWSANALFYEEIPRARDPARAMFFVGGKDAILNAERIKRYLRSHGVRDGLRFCPEGHHGEALLKGSREHEEIMKWLETES